MGGVVFPTPAYGAGSAASVGNILRGHHGCEN